MLVLSKKHTKGLERWSNNKAFALLAEEPSIYFETLIEDLTYNLDPGKSTVFFSGLWDHPNKHGICFMVTNTYTHTHNLFLKEADSEMEQLKYVLQNHLG